MSRKCLLGLLVISCCLLHYSTGLYFYVTKEPRCFTLDIPSNTEVRVSYESPDTGTTKEIICQIFPPDEEDMPADRPIIEEPMQEVGNLPFKSSVAGQHYVCLMINTRDFSVPRKTQMKFSMKLKVGSDAVDYEGIAKQDNLDELQVQILKLSNRIKSVQQRQDYAQEKEAVFRDTSERNNSLAMWVSVIQIIVLTSSAAYQVYHLKRYFHKKKLV